LESILLQALVAGPVLVSFSGGRDSSTLLALATHVAQREGLTPPVPLTCRYGGDKEADETEWQELVVRHLRLDDWVVVHAAAESDGLGERAAEVIRRVGHNVFPPGASIAGVRASRARGATLIDGEPGDWILGTHRLTYPHQLKIRRFRANAHEWAAVGRALAPSRVRQVASAREVGDLPWLTPAGNRLHRRAARADARAEPLRWDRAVRRIYSWRFFASGIPSLTAVIRAYGAEPLQPLRDPSFVAAYADWGGWLGVSGRTAAHRLLCGDLLPEEVLRRTSKASFNRQLFGPATRDFAESWDGSGVDNALIDPEHLRREWLADVPDGRTLGLLHQAWLSRLAPALEKHR
jgi:asparagine synthase (glutamine-hydrolysing)